MKWLAGRIMLLAAVVSVKMVNLRCILLEVRINRLNRIVIRADKKIDKLSIRLWKLWDQL